MGHNISDLAVLPVRPTNLTGESGERCGHCSGLGFTNLITGGVQGCQRCDRTGIEPINSHELQRQINNLTEVVKEMIKQVVELQRGRS